MANLQASSLGDLIAMTLPELRENRITDISYELRENVAMNSLLRKNSVKLDSGTSVRWRVKLNNTGSFRFVGLYAHDEVNPADTTVEADHPWRHFTVNYAIDERELAMNRTPRRMVEILKERRHSAMIDQAEGMESAFWGYPLSTDDTTAHGVAYWIVKSATAATLANNNGFNGTAQSGYTTVAGLNPTSVTRWRNYTDAYTTVAKDDLVRKLRRALEMCKFTPPASGGTQELHTGDQWGLYTNYAVRASLEELLEAQNENIGNDIASKDGATTFHRMPVMSVPKLDADSTGPVYGINWGSFKTYILRGFWMKECRIENVPGQHTVCAVHMDSTANWICTDRRRNFVLSTGTTTPNN